MHLDAQNRTDRFRALLVDVGGTLLPDDRLDRPEQIRARLELLSAALPELDVEHVAVLLADIVADAKDCERRDEQVTEARIAGTLGAASPALAGRGRLVRRALSRRTGQEWPPFPGGPELLAAAAERGLRRVIVSNTAFTSEVDWWEEVMPALGLQGLVDAVVTSFDVGYRKPHRAVFERALDLAACGPAACVFIGDNERNDVEPARALGMTVIRVAIQGVPTSPSRAHHVATSLREARQLLESLVPARPG